MMLDFQLFVLYELSFTKIYSEQCIMKKLLMITISKCYRRVIYLETHV